MDYLPIAVNLKNKKVIVIGGGPVAQRKVLTLLEFNASVEIIAPQTTEKIKSLVASSNIAWLRRTVREEDIKDASLVIAATNREDVNERVSLWAHNYNIPINVVDRPFLSDFISLALLKKEKALIAVYSDAKDPVLSRDLKNYLKEKWDDFLLYRDKL